jgi:hemerythrin superfamily protein
MCYNWKEKGHNIADCLKEEALKQVYQNQTVWFGKTEYLISAENFRTSRQCNKGFKVALDKHMNKNKNTKRQSKNKVCRIKHQTCYTYRDNDHLSKDCPKTQSFIHKVVKTNISHMGSKNDTSTIKVISSPYDSPRGIWVLKHFLTNHEGSNKAWVSKLA